MLDDRTPLVEKTRLSTSPGEPAQNLPTPPAESTPSPTPRAPAPVSPDSGTDHPTQTHVATGTDGKATTTPLQTAETLSTKQRQTSNDEGMTPAVRLLSSIGARRPPPLPDRIYVGQPQREVRRAAYMGNRAQSQYEYIELTTSDSESSQCPGLDSSDDDGHKDCGLGGYERCPDNPANY